MFQFHFHVTGLSAEDKQQLNRIEQKLDALFQLENTELMKLADLKVRKSRRTRPSRSSQRKLSWLDVWAIGCFDLGLGGDWMERLTSCVAAPLPTSFGAIEESAVTLINGTGRADRRRERRSRCDPGSGR